MLFLSLPVVIVHFLTLMYYILLYFYSSIKRKVTFVEKETIAKSLKTKLEHTDAEVEELKKKLGAAHNK